MGALVAPFAVGGTSAAVPMNIARALPSGTGGAHPGNAPFRAARPSAITKRRQSARIASAMQAALNRECNSSLSSPAKCDAASLRAINNARRAEGVAPMMLPPGYEQMSLVDQLVTVTNAERVGRRLPAWEGPEQALGHLASEGAAQGEDPSGPSGKIWASNLATGVLTVLEADYEWMYNDGPGGTNAGCTTARPSDCWAHRRNILSPWSGTMGAASQPVKGQRLVVAEVMVEDG